ncbi:MAG TPA: right-handed parallel beta-helix repeat-containing protein [Sedimentisphaerales bacterium]|nr:right-handed parallel beta-helix repeat-containing protein [Sedimentisphaerales bacterium]
MKNRWIALLLVSSALAGPLYAATYYVDDDVAIAMARSRMPAPVQDGSVEHPFGTIEQAIEIAADGDTIVVAPGWYLSPDPWQYAELNFKGKSVRLVGSAPTDFGVVEQTVLCGVIVFDGIEDANSLLQGFKIQNHTCGGILGNGTQATVSHCILSGNGPCGATVIKDVKGPIRNCLIVDNTTFHDCGTGPVVSGCPTLINCTIANNLTGVEIDNEDLTDPEHVFLKNCILHGNQSAQILTRWTGTIFPRRPIEYCLLGPSTSSSATATRGGGWVRGDMYADPCFVQAGRWVDAPTGSRTTTRTGDGASMIGTRLLIEGDYHLRTEGWRWNPKSLHGSNWYYDATTSRAVDAGDPMDLLDEEPERAPDDPEGRWGFNHAIDMGAYGGTTQGSLSPTYGEAPGVGAVDLRNYWPLAMGNSWTVRAADGVKASTLQAYSLSIAGYEGVALSMRDAPDWAPTVYCIHFNRTLYMTQTATALYRLPTITDPLQAQYPLYLIPGSTIRIPIDPFAKGGSQYKDALVVRTTLDEALSGSDLDRTPFVVGTWADVIALRAQNADGTAGELITIFARGFGPLMIAGQPVERASVGSRSFRAAGITDTGAARR